MIQYVDLLSDTICSPITAPGHSGVAVVRISGELALKATLQSTKISIEKIKSHQVYFTKFRDQEDQVIDEVLLTYFKKGSSFTGDETVEVSCHGNPLIVNRIINQYLNFGCRSAERGEFSFRAFYNGKIDLVQAESIHNLVTSNNVLGSTSSLSQLEGQLSETFQSLEKETVLAMSHLEATIDFTEEDIDPGDYDLIINRLDGLSSVNQELLKTYDVGKNLQKGYQVLLLGKTNVGKSSLFNAIFGEDKAIVTEVHGTTRDLISGQTFLGSANVEFIDSAGIRESEDKIENIGIEKSLSSMENSDLVLNVVDLTSEIDYSFIKGLPVSKSFLVLNKKDLINDPKQIEATRSKLVSECGFSSDRVFVISALENSGINQLKSKIEAYLSDRVSFEGVTITQARHFNHLSQYQFHLDQALKLLSVSESPDLISQELGLALTELHKLQGKEYNDEVLDNIFSQFCIGK